MYMESEENNPASDSGEDMMANQDCHVNIQTLSELFDEESVDAYIANLNDWD